MMQELTIKQFANAYAKRWAKVKKSKTWPSRPLVLSWCQEWAKINPPLARKIIAPTATGEMWMISRSALLVEPK